MSSRLFDSRRYHRHLAQWSGGLHALRANARHGIEGRRRKSSGMVVLLAAAVMFLASVGLTIMVAFSLDHRIAAIEAVVGIGDE